jgi:hypothetical protein
MSGTNMKTRKGKSYYLLEILSFVFFIINIFNLSPNAKEDVNELRNEYLSKGNALIK